MRLQTTLAAQAATDKFEGDRQKAAASLIQESEAKRQEVGAKSQEINAEVRRSEDAGEEAEIATNAETNQSPETMPPPAADDEGYVWPEGSESAPAILAAPEPAPAPLPSLEDLVQRLPPDVRATYDDLFRPKYVGVKRVAAEALKN